MTFGSQELTKMENSWIVAGDIWMERKRGLNSSDSRIFKLQCQEIARYHPKYIIVGPSQSRGKLEISTAKMQNHCIVTGDTPFEQGC